MDAVKTASKRVVQKTAKATGDLADKISSLGKSKSKEKENETQENYIPLEKGQQIDNLRFFKTYYKNGIPKKYKLARYNN